MSKQSRLIFVIALACVIGLAAAALSAGDPPAFRPTEKAFYADQALVNFVRPGLTFKITKAEIAADGTVTAWIKMTDPKGMGLDREGIVTPGVISASFLIGYIPSYDVPYVSYITRSRTGAAGTVTQATGENTGKWTKIADGDYTYTFLNKVPASYDKNATHTIGVYGSRNLDEFELGRNYSDAVYNFVPNGTPVTVTRDIIRTQSCNNCHDALGMHGGSRRSMEVCNLCHTPQTPSSAEGVTTDMRVMIHKIHFGENLPSVQAGKKYTIAGHDYSEIVFPAPAMACKACHQDKSVAGATQADFYLSNPTRAACGSCHDDVNFDTGENHAGMPQFSDSQCKNCHMPKGELDFDTSISGAHTVPIESSLLAGVVVKIDNVTDVAPGRSPIVAFTVKDKTGKAVDIKTLNSLRIYMAGPSTDIPSYIREDALKAEGPGDGRYFWTMAAKLPADAKGSWQFGMEGYRTTPVLAGTQKQRSIRDYTANTLFQATVGHGPAAPPRTVVSSQNCNKCHYTLEFHGGNRNDAQMCTFCHNPNLVEGAEQISWNYATMIHRYHGEEVRYPGRLNNCNQCHTGDSQGLPLKEGLMPVKNGLAPINPTGPVANACLSCHNEPVAWQHAAANTTKLGESCSVCHGRNGEFSVSKVHAQ